MPLGSRAVTTVPATIPSGAIPVAKFDIHPELTWPQYYATVNKAMGIASPSPSDPLLLSPPADTGSNRYGLYLSKISANPAGASDAPSALTKVFGIFAREQLIYLSVAAVLAGVAIAVFMYYKKNNSGFMRRRPSY